MKPIHFNKGDFEMFETFKKLLVEEFNVNPADVTMDAELTGTLGLNSIDLAELAYKCSEDLNIDIDDDAVGGFKTVGDVVAYLENAK